MSLMYSLITRSTLGPLGHLSGKHIQSIGADDMVCDH